MLIKSQNVRVVHRAHEGTFPFAGHTVLAAKTSLQDVFSIPYFAEARVNGEHALVDRILRPGDVLSFQRRFGFKGAEDLPRHELEAEGLLRTYPGLVAIANEVKAKGLSASDAVDLMKVMVARWAYDEFGPVTERIQVTLNSIVNMIGTPITTSENDIKDGPTNFGTLRYNGDLYSLNLTPLEVLLVRALWNREPMTVDRVCEAMYGDSEERETGLKAVQKRANAKFRKGKLLLTIVSKSDTLLLRDRQ